MPKMQHKTFSMKADERNICDQIINARGFIYLFILNHAVSRQAAAQTTAN